MMISPISPQTSPMMPHTTQIHTNYGASTSSLFGSPSVSPRTILIVDIYYSLIYFILFCISSPVLSRLYLWGIKYTLIYIYLYIYIYIYTYIYIYLHIYTSMPQFITFHNLLSYLYFVSLFCLVQFIIFYVLSSSLHFISWFYLVQLIILYVLLSSPHFVSSFILFDLSSFMFLLHLFILSPCFVSCVRVDPQTYINTQILVYTHIYIYIYIHLYT